MKTFLKDPDAVLDFSFNWSAWLSTDETISAYTITAGSGITKDSDSESDGIVTVWLSGGVVEMVYEIACKIETNQGRTDERTLAVRVSER